MSYTYKATVFNQILDFIPDILFQRFAIELLIDKHSKVFNIRSVFVVVLFSHIAKKDSIRDIVTSLKAEHDTRYHLGIENVARNTVSVRLMKEKVAEFFEKLYYGLFDFYKRVWNVKTIGELPDNVYLLDSTIVTLTLSVFKRAIYRTRKGGVKAHTLLNGKTFIPECVYITVAKKHDVTAVLEVSKNLVCGSIIVMDRGYVDYDLWFHLDKKGLFRVTRTKTTTQYSPVLLPKVIEIKLKEGTIIYDSPVTLTSTEGTKAYPKPLRVIRFHHKEQNKVYEYITNLLDVPAETIVLLYKHRRQVELFFKRIKQNLEIKSYLGTSESAVKTQIRVALIYYLIVSIIARQANLPRTHMLTITRTIRELCMQRKPLMMILPIVTNTEPVPKSTSPDSDQIGLFG